MRRLLPGPGLARDGGTGSGRTDDQDGLDDAALARLYAYPPEPGPFVRGNMVASLDGAAAVDGRSGGLSSPGDRRVFWALRTLADVIMVGAGTARAEGYHPTTIKPPWDSLGLRAGRPAAPPLALVSRSLSLDPAAPLISGAPAGARTIIITCAASPADRRGALAAAADVIVAGEQDVDLAAAAQALAARGLGRVLCEGGPRLLRDLTAARVLDELCLTISPALAGPGAVRILEGEQFPAQQARLAHLLAEDDVLFARYRLAPPDPRPPHRAPS
ncbi:MAG TPA: pyrimidine reductase family protein [Trebonia sp.]|jgi:riboflavin biosynthesis pyrimidine reductase|nr:pyrimidine reductase family protein [Trebonia sp.]